VRQVKEGIRDEMKGTMRSEEADLNKVDDSGVRNKKSNIEMMMKRQKKTSWLV
jgi:hypothetical protein